MSSTPVVVLSTILGRTPTFDEYKLAVNSEILDGNFKPLPHKYRLREGERVEVLRPLVQDPKSRRLKKV